jgi:hypothetical protein
MPSRSRIAIVTSMTTRSTGGWVLDEPLGGLPEPAMILALRLAD